MKEFGVDGFVPGAIGGVEDTRDWMDAPLVRGTVEETEGTGEADTGILPKSTVSPNKALDPFNCTLSVVGVRSLGKGTVARMGAIGILCCCELLRKVPPTPPDVDDVTEGTGDGPRRTVVEGREAGEFLPRLPVTVVLTVEEEAAVLTL